MREKKAKAKRSARDAVGGTEATAVTSPPRTEINPARPLSPPAAPALVAPSLFPELAFRGLFADYRALVGPTTEAPDEFCWAALLCALSALVGRSVRLEGGTSGTIPILHTVLLGVTGKARKSTAIDDAIELLVNPLATGLHDGPDAQPQLHLVGEEVGPRRQGPGHTSDTTGLPPLDVVRGAGSGEGFGEALSDRDGVGGRRVLFVVDEFGGLLEKAARGAAGNLVDFIIRSYDAPSRWDHRTRTSSFTITNGAGVFLCASTLDWLRRSLSESHVRRGLANRFLWISADRKAHPLSRRPPVDPARHLAFVLLVRTRLKLASGRTFSLSRQASDLHEAFYLREYHRTDDSELLGAATARADGMALRLSLLLAVADGAPEISRDHVEAAWAVVDYSRLVVGELIEALLVETREGAEVRVHAAARRVAAETSGPVSRRDVQQRIKGSHGLGAAAFDRAWKALVADGCLVEVGPRAWTVREG